MLTSSGLSTDVKPQDQFWDVDQGMVVVVHGDDVHKTGNELCSLTVQQRTESARRQHKDMEETEERAT